MHFLWQLYCIKWVSKAASSLKFSEIASFYKIAESLADFRELLSSKDRGGSESALELRLRSGESVVSFCFDMQ